VNAALGMAREMDALCDTDHAIEQLRVIIAQRPAAPYAAVARAHYQLGLVYDRVGRRSEAVTAYQSALAANPSDDRLELNATLRALVKRPSIARVCR
jgi:tetratricopeptide (TPR) repeat protein